MSLSVVVLAAGRGTRMGSCTPKVMHKVAGKPMLSWVLGCADTLNPKHVTVVDGVGGDILRENFVDHSHIRWARQDHQLGTGHAVQVAIAQSSTILSTDHTLILLGDMPLLTADSLQVLVEKTPENGVGVITASVNNPEGLGRIVRDISGSVMRIVEHKDATESERSIREINTGAMLLPNLHLKKWLSRLSCNNQQQEYYLTDVVAMAIEDGIEVVGCQVLDQKEAMGVNTKIDLSTAERAMQDRQARELMCQGANILDPSRFDLRGTLSCGSNVTIDVGCVFEGNVVLGDDVTVGPNVIIRNATIAANTVVEANSMIDGADIGVACTVGPFARIRPGTVLSDKAKVGNFVEIKKSTVGDGSKINHLSYIGDAKVGSDVNIGAGTITCNYDGKNKHQTTVEDGAFIGSDCQLVAPVVIKEGALIAAGTTVWKDANANTLTLNRKDQISKSKKGVSKEDATNKSGR